MIPPLSLSHSENDVGKYKATVAADFINARIRTAKVTAHPTRIEEFGPDFYRRTYGLTRFPYQPLMQSITEFTVIVCGLDSIPARRWINSMVVCLLLLQDLL